MRKFFAGGYWKHPLYTYRLWRAENSKWGTTKQVWEFIGRNRQHAYQMVDNSLDEEMLRARGQVVAEAFRKSLGITPEHKVLEVGCGVARVGRELAPACQEWWGCDISGGMIDIARERTAHLDNVHLVTLKRSALDEIPSDTFDRVYCHTVLMHLTEANIFNYVREMRRVTKPGGIIFYDALNLLTEAGWVGFSWEMEHYQGRDTLPVHHSRYSTPQEMSRYAEKADLDILFSHETWACVQTICAKRGDDCRSPEERAGFHREAAARIDLVPLAEMYDILDKLTAGFLAKHGQ